MEAPPATIKMFFGNACTASASTEKNDMPFAPPVQASISPFGQLRDFRKRFSLSIQNKNSFIRKKYIAFSYETKAEFTTSNLRIIST